MSTLERVRLNLNEKSGFRIPGRPREKPKETRFKLPVWAVSAIKGEAVEDL